MDDNEDDPGGKGQVRSNVPQQEGRRPAAPLDRRGNEAEGAAVGCQEVSLERSRFLREPRRRLGLLRVGKQGGAGSQREGVGKRQRGA